MYRGTYKGTKTSGHWKYGKGSLIIAFSLPYLLSTPTLDSFELDYVHNPSPALGTDIPGRSGLYPISCPSQSTSVPNVEPHLRRETWCVRVCIRESS